MGGETQYSIDTGVVRTMGVVDYVIFVITLVISAGVGIFYAVRDRRRNTTKEFFLGGRKMGVFPVTMSLVVTFQSGLTILGNPTEIYNYNTMYCWVLVTYIVSNIVAAYIFIPFFYRLGITTTFEYLELRFGTGVRIFTSVFILIQTSLYMAFLLYAPALALNAVTGVGLWGCVVGIGIVVTFYTTLGGMKAVLWTDTFQAIVMIAGLLAVLIQGSVIQGGFHDAWKIAENRSRVYLDDFDPKTRHSVWTIVVGGGIYWTYLYGVHQAQVQRCLSCTSYKKAGLAIILNLPGLLAINLISFLIGILIFAFYADCHPVKYGVIGKADQLLPLYTMDILGHVDGIVGLFVACIFSGSLSSLSSALNAISAIIIRDYIQGLGIMKNVSEFRSTVISKIIVVIWGAIAIGLAWVVSRLGPILQAVYVVHGILNGPILGVFTLGMFFPWANRWGAVCGTLVAYAFLFWIGFGAFVHEIREPISPLITTGCNWTARPTPPPPTLSPFLNPTLSNVTTTVAESSSGILEPLYRMSYLWYTPLAMIVVWGIGMLISALTGFVKPKSLDPRLICPIFDKLFLCLPDKILKPLRFGIVHKGKYDLPLAKSGESFAVPESKEAFADTPVNEKQPGDVINGDSKPSVDKNGVSAKSDLEKAGHDNEGFSEEGETEPTTINVRL